MLGVMMLMTVINDRDDGDDDDVNVHSDVNVIFGADIDVDGLNYPMNFVPLAMLVKPNDCQKCFKIVQLNLVLFNPEMDFLLKPLNVINPLNLFFLFSLTFISTLIDWFCMTFFYRTRFNLFKKNDFKSNYIYLKLSLILAISHFIPAKNNHYILF